MVGARRHEIILTARTGRSGLRHRLKEMGYELSSEGLETAYAKFLTIADKQGVLEETALHQLVQA